MDYFTMIFVSYELVSFERVISPSNGFKKTLLMPLFKIGIAKE